MPFLPNPNPKPVKANAPNTTAWIRPLGQQPAPPKAPKKPNPWTK